MTLNYSNVWKSLNDLEAVTSKICSAREILDSAIAALDSGKQEKAETLMYATDEYLEYYLKDFDEKFKVAWDEIVVNLKKEDSCMPFWGHSDIEYLFKEQSTFDIDPAGNCVDSIYNNYNYFANDILTQDRISNFPGEQYTEDELNAMCDAAEKRKWVLPISEYEDLITSEKETFIELPDDFLKETGWKEDDELEWVDNKDGTFTLRKVNV